MSSTIISNTKLEEAFRSLYQSTKVIANDNPSISVDEGERHITLTDYQFGTKLHFSLPSLPEYPGDTESIIGLYAYIEIPFYAKIHTMINYDDETGLAIRNISLCYDEVNLDALSTKDDLAMYVANQLIKLFKTVNESKTLLVADLIKNKFNIEREVSFETLTSVPGPMGKNDYLYFHDDLANVVFVNDVTGNNLTSGINNIERIYGHFNPPTENECSDEMFGCIGRLFSRKPKCTPPASLRTKIVIVFKNLDNRSIIYFDENFSHYVPNSSYSDISAIWAPMLLDILPISFRQ